jgi:hypothetical protein
MMYRTATVAVPYKSFPQRHPFGIVCVAVVVTVLVLGTVIGHWFGIGRPSGYPSNFVSNYAHQVVQNDNSDSVSYSTRACMAQYFEDHMSYRQFRHMMKSVDSGAPVPAIMIAAAGEC